MSILRNSFYGLTGSLLPTVVTLITVPVYLRLIGVDRYGILVIAWALLGYFGVFDLGLGRATAQRIATLQHAGPTERAEVFWTALALNMSFGVFGGLLLWPVATFFFSTYLHIADPTKLELLAAIPWLVASLPVSTVNGVLAGALQGRERFAALNVCRVLESILSQLLPLVAVWVHGPDLAWLVSAALLGRVFISAVLLYQCRSHVPLSMPPSARRALVLPLFRFGGWVTMTGFIGPLLTTLDRVLIGSMAGPKAVTYYSVPYSLISRVAAFPGSLADALFPRFSASSEQDRDRLMEEAVYVLSVTMTPLIIGGMLMMEPFLRWWVGSETAQNSASVGVIIALGFWFNGFAYIAFARIQAQGRPDLVAKCHLAELLPYLIFLAFALHIWGVLGAALAWSLRVTVDAMLLFWVGRFAPRSFMEYIPPLLFLGLTVVAVFVFHHASVFRWAIGSIALLGSLAWAWRAAPTSIRRLGMVGTQFLCRIRPGSFINEKTV